MGSRHSILTTLGLFAGWLLAWSAIVLIAADSASAQQQLTAEQRALLEQLPASQRDALEQQFRQQLQQRQQGTETFDGAQRDAVRPIQPVEPSPQGSRDEFERDAGRRYFEPGDTLVLRFLPPLSGVQLGTAAERELMDEIRRRVEQANPYRLDAQGRIDLPGVARIPLAGLTEEQAEIRLRAERLLGGLVPQITRLPLRPAGTEALRPFGYELFEQHMGTMRGTFGDATRHLAAPSDYVLGPGDRLRVQLFGNRNAEYQVEVGRDGTISLPELGPVTVAGLRYETMREELRQRVEAQFIGTRVSATLSELRSIRVFVVGEVRRPGAYTISALSSITDALLESGGINERGSMREVRLMRNGELVATLDFYGLLLRGDTRQDVRIEPGDVIHVPLTGPRITVAGEVRRPAIYEVRDESTVGEVLEIAGGPLSSALLSRVTLERLQPASGLDVIDLDLNAGGEHGFGVRDGDVMHVPLGLPQMEQAVELRGHVHNDGRFQWRPGLRLTDVLPESRVLRPQADVNYVLIRREPVPNTRIEVLSADLQAAWTAPGGERDLLLQPRDVIHVFDLAAGRSHIVEPLLDQMRTLNPSGEPVPVVRVGGSVRAPGTYPLEPGMQVADLLRAAGGLNEAAFREQAELTRYESVNGNVREMSVRDVDLLAVNSDAATENLFLQPHDYLNVRPMPRWRDQAVVQVRGEVVFPGDYLVDQGETLSNLLERVGGLTEHSYARGAVFVRENLQEREREQMQTLAGRIESDLVTLSLSDPDNFELLSVGRSLLEQIRNTEPAGRLVIDINALLAGNLAEDILLRDGDRLLIPQRPQEVTVLGEVQYATSHLHDSTLLRDDYIARSGGITTRADRQRIYVVRASGEVVAGEASRWFGRAQGMRIEPGDTIVVPMDTERVRPLVMWSSVTQIVYNLAIAAAAVNSF